MDPKQSNADLRRIPQDPAIIDQHERRFRSLFSDGPAGQAFARLDGRFAAVNNAFCRMLDRRPADIVGQTILELTHPDDRERNAVLLDDLIAGRLGSFQIAKRYLVANGAVVPVLNTVSIIDAGSERLLAAVSVELREHTHRTGDLKVEVDDSKGTTVETVGNEADDWRHTWPRVLDGPRLKCLWDAVTANGHELVSAMDPEGTIRYSTGAAARLIGATPEDLVGRRAFDIVHVDDRNDVIAAFATCVDQKVGWNGLRLRAQRPDGSAVWVESSSVAHVNTDGTLIGFAATTRLLDDDESRSARRASMRTLVEQVLSGRHISTAWQPIYSLETGRVVGVEALSRFTHADVTQSPDRWFADAHDIGLGGDLEVLAIEVALASAVKLPSSVYLSVNVSPMTLASNVVANVLRRAGFPAERIVLELTEHVSIEDYGPLTAALSELRGLGVRLAVDDAGAGFASFRHILRLKPDIIKLDQSITHGIDGNAAQRALGAALVMFAIDVGSIDVIAEGVETDAELSTISTLGIDAVQGYYLARPDSPDSVDFTALAPHAWSKGG